MRKNGKKLVKKGEKHTHTNRRIGLLFNFDISNGFANKRVRNCKSKALVFFDIVLSLEVKTLSLVCFGELFVILTPEILSD